MEERKRFHFYSRFAKMTTLGLQTLCMAGFILSVVMAGYVLNSVGSVEDILQRQEYYVTTGCGEQLAMEIHENSSYGKYKVMFETRGSYDEDKTVDVLNLSERDSKKQDEDTSYTVGVLRTMQENSVDENLTYLLDQCYYDSELQEVYMDGELEIGDISEEYWDGLLAGQTTVSGDTLSATLKDKSDMERYQYLVALNEALSRLGVYLDGRNVNMDSNLKFFVRDTENGNVYTNVREWENLTRMPEETKNGQIGDAAFILLSYTRTDGKIVFDQNAEHSSQQYLQNFFRNTPILSDNEQAVVALDTSYPISDDIKAARDAYENYQPHFKFLVAAAIICFIIWVICFIIATIQTGRNEYAGEIILGRFDRVPTEPAAVIAIILGGCILGIAVSVSFGGNEGAFLAIYESVVLTIGFIIFMWAYLSLVRRIKAKTLWSNSLIKALVNVGNQVYRARTTSGKTMILFIVFVLFHIFMIAAGEGFGVFVVLMCDIMMLLHLLREASGKEAVKEGIQRLAQGELDYKIDVENLQGDNRELAENINEIGDGMQVAVERAMKDEQLKAELITNVSHDLRTPLTSIINYVDLLKRENLQDPKIKGYIEVLDKKSQRLKQLTEDLIEASKASTGNIELHMSRIQVQQLLKQAYGEYGERLSDRGLIQKLNLADEPVIIWADGKQLWRIFENLLNNIAKYAMPNTRVYIDLKIDGGNAVLTFKNISEYPLNISADELTERFARGDESRSTEGSGLGLSIAKNLTELQGGLFDIYLDGDLFKVTLTFERQKPEESLD